MSRVFEGAGIALITPFREDGSVNYEKLKELLEDQIANKTDAIIICGTTGEPSTLTIEEHLDVIEATVKHVNKRIPVIAGSGSNCTQTAVYLSTEAEKRGADGLLVVSPYYNKATQKGLIKHFSTVAASVKIPIILYNIPGRTGVTIQPETISYLVRNVENIVGVKEASGDMSAIAKMFHLCQDIDIAVYSGNDDQIIPIMSLGGVGVISVLSHVAPRQTHEMCRAMLDGDVKKAAKMQLYDFNVIKKIFTEDNPIPEKSYMNIQGKDVGGLRLPLTYMEEEHQKALEKSMREYGIL